MLAVAVASATATAIPTATCTAAIATGAATATATATPTAAAAAVADYILNTQTTHTTTHFEFIFGYVEFLSDRIVHNSLYGVFYFCYRGESGPIELPCRERSIEFVGFFWRYA